MESNKYIQGVEQETKENMVARGLEAAGLNPIVKVGKGLVRRVPLVGSAFAVEDAYSGYHDAGKIYGTPNPTIPQKIASTVGGLMHGLSWGTIPTDGAAITLYGRKPRFSDLRTPTEAESKFARLYDGDKYKWFK